MQYAHTVHAAHIKQLIYFLNPLNKYDLDWSCDIVLYQATNLNVIFHFLTSIRLAHVIRLWDKNWHWLSYEGGYQSKLAVMKPMNWKHLAKEKSSHLVSMMTSGFYFSSVMLAFTMSTQSTDVKLAHWSWRARTQLLIAYYCPFFALWKAANIPTARADHVVSRY